MKTLTLKRKMKPGTAELDGEATIEVIGRGKRAYLWVGDPSGGYGMYGPPGLGPFLRKALHQVTSAEGSEG